MSGSFHQTHIKCLSDANASPFLLSPYLIYILLVLCHAFEYLRPFHMCALMYLFSLFGTDHSMRTMILMSNDTCSNRSHCFIQTEPLTFWFVKRSWLQHMKRFLKNLRDESFLIKLVYPTGRLRMSHRKCTPYFFIKIHPPKEKYSDCTIIIPYDVY